MSEHDKRREWCLRLSTLVVNNRTPMDRHYGDEIDVREVRPGSIEITREELEPLLEYFAEYGSLALEIKLFGPLPEGTEVGK